MNTKCELPGLYWVRTKSEVENGWSVEYFDGHHWANFGRETPDEIGPSVEAKPTIHHCPFCGEQSALEIRENAMCCGMCGASGPQHMRDHTESQAGRFHSIVTGWNFRHVDDINEPQQDKIEIAAGEVT